MDDKGTPARDHHDADDFDAHDEAISDQQGETAPQADNPPKDGDGEGEPSKDA